MEIEYKVVNVNTRLTGSRTEKELQDTCDELGKEGWDLVNFESYDLSTKFIPIFKREKKN